MEVSFLALELTYTILWLCVRIITWVRQKGIDWKREAILLLFYVNLAVVIRFVFFPRDLVNGHIPPLVYEGLSLPLRVNLLPLISLLDYANLRDILWNVAGNASMFLPSGIILPIVFRKLDRFWKVVAAGALLSLLIEILQLSFPTRASDIDDVLLNILGIAAGYGIYAAIKRLRR